MKAGPVLDICKPSRCTELAALIYLFTEVEEKRLLLTKPKC